MVVFRVSDRWRKEVFPHLTQISVTVHRNWSWHMGTTGRKLGCMSMTAEVDKLALKP